MRWVFESFLLGSSLERGLEHVVDVISRFNSPIWYKIFGTFILMSQKYLCPKALAHQFGLHLSFWWQWMLTPILWKHSERNIQNILRQSLDSGLQFNISFHNTIDWQVSDQTPTFTEVLKDLILIHEESNNKSKHSISHNYSKDSAITWDWISVYSCKMKVREKHLQYPHALSTKRRNQFMLKCGPSHIGRN